MGETDWKVWRATPVEDRPIVRVGNTYSGLRVVGLISDRSACGGYRVSNPIFMLGMLGASVDLVATQSLVHLLNYDVIIAPRQQDPAVYEALRVCAWEGKWIIYEIDDDLDSVLPSSPAYRVYHPGADVLKWIRRFMQNSHGIVTTTPEIARWYGRYNKNTRVIENYIDFSLRNWSCDVEWTDGVCVIRPRPIPRLSGTEDKVLIMWSGGSTHLEDLMEMGEDIKRVLEKLPDVLFLFYSGKQLFEWFMRTYDPPTDKVVFIPPRGFVHYPSGLFGADIGLAPLKPCQFNLAKSSLKILEYGAAGMVTVASNVGPYARFFSRHPGTILSVGRGRGRIPSWFDAIEYLVTHREEMEKRKHACRKIAIAGYALEKNIHLWPIAWKSIIESARAGWVGPPDDNENGDGSMGDGAGSLGRSWGKFGPNDQCPCGETELKYKECCKEAWG